MANMDIGQYAYNTGQSIGKAELADAMKRRLAQAQINNLMRGGGGGGEVTHVSRMPQGLDREGSWARSRLAEMGGGGQDDYLKGIPSADEAAFAAAQHEDILGGNDLAQRMQEQQLLEQIRKNYAPDHPLLAQVETQGAMALGADAEAKMLGSEAQELRTGLEMKYGPKVAQEHWGENSPMQEKLLGMYLGRAVPAQTITQEQVMSYTKNLQDAAAKILDEEERAAFLKAGEEKLTAMMAKQQAPVDFRSVLSGLNSFNEQIGGADMGLPAMEPAAPAAPAKVTLTPGQSMLERLKAASAGAKAPGPGAAAPPLAATFNPTKVNDLGRDGKGGKGPGAAPAAVAPPAAGNKYAALPDTQFWMLVSQLRDENPSISQIPPDLRAEMDRRSPGGAWMKGWQQ